MLDAAVAPVVAHHANDSAANASAVLACCGNDSTRWCVAQTHPQAERWAEQNLTRLGFRVYLPMLAVQRRDNAIRSLKHTVLVPLFPRYLFVANNSPHHWRPIREAPGVATVLTTGDRVQYAPQGVVEALWASEASRRTIGPLKALWGAGDPCRVRHGAMEDHMGVIVRVTTSHAYVALMLLGALREVRVRLTALAPAS